MVDIQLSSMIKIASIFAFFVSIHAADREEIGKNVTLAPAGLPQETERIYPVLKINRSPDTKSVKIGSTISFACNISPSEQGDEVWWTKDGNNLTDIQINYPNSTATINIKVEHEKDIGSYICKARTRKGILINETIDVTFLSEPGKTTGGHGDRVKLDDSAVLSCQLEGYPLRNFKWIKIDDRWKSEELEDFANVSQINANHVSMTLSFTNACRKNNGTYECSAYDYNEEMTIKNRFDLIVIEVPEVSIDFIKAVGVDKVYLNWTFNDWNDPVQKYFVEYNKIGKEDWTSYSEEIDGGNSSYALKGLEKQTDYHFRISASNFAGRSPTYMKSKWIRTLAKDPKFIPKVSVLENTENSITLVWTEPPEDMRDHLFYYEIMATRLDKIEKYHCPVQPVNIYILLNLDFEVTSYQLNVQACSNYTRLCGGWSPKVKVQTLSKNNQSSSTAGLHPTVNLVSFYLVVKYAVL